jgi:hypothetical protein
MIKRDKGRYREERTADSRVPSNLRRVLMTGCTSEA